jgi:RimJ/RimL family protein N-acetyltransferase
MDSESTSQVGGFCFMEFKHVYMGRTSEGKDEYSCNIINNKDDVVGYCKYYKPYEERDEVVIIEFINIRYEHRRRGYATKMVKELQSKYTLKWDYRFSEVGRKWYDGLIKKGVISE